MKCLGKIGWCASLSLSARELLANSPELFDYSGSGTIQIDYGHLDREVVRSSKAFHTRQIFCDVFITVHRAVVAHALDISRLRALPESSATHSRSASVVNLGKRDAALDKRLEDSLRDVDDGRHCLVGIDVMNVYGKPFEVKLERREERKSSRSPVSTTGRLKILVQQTTSFTKFDNVSNQELLFGSYRPVAQSLYIPLMPSYCTACLSDSTGYVCLTKISIA